MTRELKKKAFTINSQNLKQTIDKQVTFILKVEPPETFFSKTWPFLAADVSYLNAC